MIFLFLALISFQAVSYENQFSLQGGVGLALTHIENENVRAGSDDDDSFALGPSLMTAVTYRWTNLELGIAGNLSYGIAPKIYQNAYGSDISGKARFRSVSFGPTIRYHLPWRINTKEINIPLTRLKLPWFKDLKMNTSELVNWSTYFTFTPVFSIITTKPTSDSHISGGSFAYKQRIKYEGAGFQVAMGISRDTSKHTETVYYELNYRLIKYDQQVVTGPEHAETNVLSKVNLNEDFLESTFILTVGFVFF